MFQFKRFVIHQEHTPMKVGTDGVLLGAWAELEEAASILDIGTGTGLQIGCISTTAVDGQIISLSGGIEQDGENRQGAAIGLGVGLGLTFLPLGGFFFLCLKGEKVDIPAGTTIFGVTVTDNYDIDIY